MINGNIKKCVRCNKNIIQEEFEEHVCNPRMNGIKDVVASYIFESQKPDDNGDKIIFVKGIDGIMYRIIHCVHNPPHGNSSKFLGFSDQPTGNRDEINRRGNSAIQQYPYNVLVPYHTVW